MVLCLEMTALPADDARDAWLLLHRSAASELDAISEVPIGVNPRALSRASSVTLELGNTAERPSALPDLLSRSLAGRLRASSFFASSGQHDEEQIWLTQVIYSGMFEAA